MSTHAILIVEDDEDDRNFILKAFHSIGKSELIYFFNSGSELLKHLDLSPRENHPALVVLDYNMPLLNGGETLNQIRAHAVYHNLPVVVFSTGFTPAIKEELKRLNVLACLEKGSMFEKLVLQARFFTELIADDVDTLMGNY